MRDIDLVYKDNEFCIPNAWEKLTPEQYQHLVDNLLLLSAGELSPGEVRMRYVCDVMNWDLRRFRTEEQIANLLVISEMVTFIFTIQYPDGCKAIQRLSDEEYCQAKRIDPHNLNFPLAAELRREDYKFVVDWRFCAQLLPVLTVDGQKYHGYDVNTEYGMLTTSLVALQFLEARALAGKRNALPLLAAVLYYPGSYNSEGAHRLARKFQKLPESTLMAVAFNFTAFDNFLMSSTDYSILTKFGTPKAKEISIDGIDALYDLSADGLGEAASVEKMNVLTYLRLMRKKTIESVKNLQALGYDIGKIANTTGLDINVINKIL